MENRKALVTVSKNRIIYLDILRILATFAVIIIHVCSQNWNKVAPSSYEWNVFNFFSGISRWAVPIFVMISGTLFLDNRRNINIKKLYTKNILRIITAFIFWSLFYTIITNDFFEKDRGNIKLFTSYTWANKNLPAIVQITHAERDEKCTSYAVDVKYINNNFKIPDIT